MRSSVIRSEHNFDSIVSSTFMLRFVPWPRSSRVASFSPVYSQVMTMHYWRGQWDRKSDSTISDVKPCSSRNWILFSTGL
jgi:hypothetical protein